MFFGNPHIPYSWETISTTYVGYTVLFSEDFFKASDRSESLQNSPLFKIGGTPILTIDEQQRMPLWREAHRIIHEDQPYTFLFFPNQMVFLDDRINNVQQIKLGLNPMQEWFVPTAEQRWTK